MKTRLEILIRARALCVMSWVGRQPRNDTENCLASAIWQASDRTEGHALNATYDALKLITGAHFISTWNDAHTLAEVLAVLDTAIAQERGGTDISIFRDMLTATEVTAS